MNKYKRKELGDYTLYKMFSLNKKHVKDEFALANFTLLAVLYIALFAVAYVQYG